MIDLEMIARIRAMAAGAVMICMVAAIGCGDGKVVDHTDENPEGEAKSLEEIRQWVDSQQVIVAPWTHELDGEILDQAIVDEERISFPRSGNEWMAELRENDIIFGTSMGHQMNIARRVLEVEETDDQIQLRTRDASMDEVFLKLHMDHQTQPHQLRPEADGEVETRGQPSWLDGIDDQWVMEGPYTFDISPSSPFTLGYCGSAAGAGSSDDDEIMTNAGSCNESPSMNPDDHSAQSSVGVAFEVKPEFKGEINGGHVKVKIDFGSSTPTLQETQCACLAYHYSSEGSQRQLDILDSACGRRLEHSWLDDRGVARRYGSPYTLLEFEKARRQVWDRPGRATEEEVYSQYQRNIDSFKGNCQGAGDHFEMRVDAQFEVALNPFSILLLKKLSFSKSIPFPFLTVRFPIPTGPLTTFFVMEGSWLFSGEVTTRGGVTWQDQAAPRAVLPIDFGIRWDRANGLQKLASQSDSSEGGFNMDWPAFTGDVAVNFSTGPSVAMKTLVWNSAGPVFEFHPYAKIGIEGSGTVGQDIEEGSVSCGLDFGMKLSAGGEIDIPFVDIGDGFVREFLDTCSTDLPGLNRCVELELCDVDSNPDDPGCDDGDPDCDDQPGPPTYVHLSVQNPDDADENGTSQALPEGFNITTAVVRRQAQSDLLPTEIFIDDAQPTDSHTKLTVLGYEKTDEQQREFLCQEPLSNPAHDDWEDAWEGHTVSFGTSMILGFDEPIEAGDIIEIKKPRTFDGYCIGTGQNLSVAVSDDIDIGDGAPALRFSAEAGDHDSDTAQVIAGDCADGHGYPDDLCWPY